MTLSIGNRVAKLKQREDETIAAELQQGEHAVEFEVEWVSGYGGRQLVMLKEIR